MNKTLFNIIFLMVLVSGLLGEAQANQKLTLILDWFPNPNHAPIFVAKEYGFFNKQGLDVEIITPSDPNDPPKWIAIGKGDIALDYQLHVLMEEARGLPIKQLGTLIDQPLNCLVVLADSPIKQILDLKDREIAFSAGEIDLLILKTMLKKAQLSLEEVKLINVHYNLTQALISKKVSAAIGMMRNFELVQLKFLGKPGRAFFPEDYGVPAYSELVFISRKNRLKQDEDHRFFKALNEARAYMLAHPQETWQRFSDSHPELNKQVNKEVWFNTLNKFPMDLQSVNRAQRDKIALFLGINPNNLFIQRGY